MRAHVLNEPHLATRLEHRPELADTPPTSDTELDTSYATAA